MAKIKTTRVGLDEVICHFAELEDPRSEINLRHPFVSVVVIALMAVLAGAGGPTAIARWALMNEDLLKGLLPLPQGVPRKDVFRRVLATLQPDAFQACYRNWLDSLRKKAAAATGIDQPVLAIDGKTSRRSHDQSKGLGALHSVSVWASEYGLSLGQVATEEKPNEITAIPVLLKLVDIRGAIVTIDAMGTQTAIAEQIVNGKADYVLALKGNQETLHDAVIEYVNAQMDTDFAKCGARRHVTEEQGHGRQEIRHYCSDAGAAEPGGRQSLERPADHRSGHADLSARRKGNDGRSLLHQQSPDGSEALRACRAGSLGN
jgi:predicted transposase YbfD/YdcC